MSEFYQQYYCPHDKKYSVIVEDDGKVSYAYLLIQKDIIGDVWLYNQQDAPKMTNWKDKSSLPFLNPKEYIYTEKEIKPILDKSEVKLEWGYVNELEEVKLYIRNDFIAIIKPKSFPGWSFLVKKDGPLAKKVKL